MNRLESHLIVLLSAFAIFGTIAAVRGDDSRVPVLVGECQKLRAPAGSTLALHAFGTGVQIYRWNGENWIFVAPEATLYADAGNHGEIGIHFGGPTWQSNSGSQVVGAVEQSCTPDPDAIPWLLLKAVVNEGHGIFAHVGPIQRLNTVGGKAPAEPGAFPGQLARVPYTADYYFYHSPR